MAQTGKGSGSAAGAAGGTTLSDMKDICYYHGWHDKSTAGVAALVRFINRTVQILSSLAPWPEYHKRDGSVTLATDDEDYTLSQTNIIQVGNVIRSGRMTPLDDFKGGIEEWLLKKTTSPASGWPYSYALRKFLSSGSLAMEMLVYPKPSSSQNGEYLYYCYRTLPAKLVNDSDYTDWPDHRVWLLEEALDIRLNSAKRDVSGVALEGADFMTKVMRAMSQSRTSYMPVRLGEPLSKKDLSLRETWPQFTE